MLYDRHFDLLSRWYCALVLAVSYCSLGRWRHAYNAHENNNHKSTCSNRQRLHVLQSESQLPRSVKTFASARGCGLSDKWPNRWDPPPLPWRSPKSCKASFARWRFFPCVVWMRILRRQDRMTHTFTCYGVTVFGRHRSSRRCPDGSGRPNRRNYTSSGSGPSGHGRPSLRRARHCVRRRFSGSTRQRLSVNIQTMGRRRGRWTRLRGCDDQRPKAALQIGVHVPAFRSRDQH